MRKSHHPVDLDHLSGKLALRSVKRLLGMAGLGLSLVFLLFAVLAAQTTPAQAAELSAYPAQLTTAPLRVTTSVASTITPTVTPWTPPANAYRISVNADGLYALPYAYLQSAGLPVDSLDPRTLAMHFMGKEIPIWVTGEDDGHFDAGDQVLFYGRNVDTLYYDGLFAGRNYVNDLVYFLSFGAGNGLRMEQVDGTPTGAPAQTVSLEPVLNETNYWYLSEYPRLPLIGADHFFGDWIQARRQATGTRSIYIPVFFVDSTVTGSLSIALQGYASGPHTVNLYLNDTKIYSGTGDWADFGNVELTVPITPGLFIHGATYLKVELANLMDRSYDKAYINWVQIDYPRNLIAQLDQMNIRGVTTGSWTFATTGFFGADVGIFDVTDSTQVRRVVNGSPSVLSPPGSQPDAAGITFGATVTPDTRLYLASPNAYKTPVSIRAVTSMTSTHTPVDILATDNRYDYLIITHSDFWEQILPLADYRSDDYKVALIDVQAIYDRFNGGMMSAGAIRDFLGYAYANWSGAKPAFVLLVGDGAVDMRNYAYDAPPTFIPPFLASIDPFLGETAADNRFVMLAGDDLLPDMAIGRFPAGSPADVITMVKKTLDYEYSPDLGAGAKNVLFVAEAPYEGDFWEPFDYYGASDLLALGFMDAPTNTLPYLPPAYSATRVYYGLNCDTEGQNPANECRALISETLNITGAMLVSYVGDSGPESWALEHLADKTLISELNNSTKLPVVLSMSALDGSFHNSNVPSLAEHFMRASGGAVANWSSTGLTWPDFTGQALMERSVFKHLFHDNITELGRLTVLAKEDMAAQDPDHRFVDLLDTFTLFGDPALRIKLYQGPWQGYMPMIGR
ncbi:MAG: hypothetical protein KA003_13710 [Caldilineaceae bacterium]|nr:hypothetical protein [Caldilineaceae bacterium]MBP8109778.1 hypothetical protein [Caldilineaceae bacterium]